MTQSTSRLNADMGKLSENWSDTLEATIPLDIRNGVINYKIYNQQNELVDATCADSISNRHFVVWLRKFDRKGVKAA